MDALLLTDQTRHQLAALVAAPPHALLLVGPVGLGKLTVATAWAAQIATPDAISVVAPDEKGTIAIETVRSLYRLTRSKQTGQQVVIVDHAEAMGIEAQNAFLKLLEEPRAGVTFVLTAPTEDALLPTIGSRMQVVVMPRISAQPLQAFAAARSTLTPQEFAQLLFVADGRPGIVATLIADPEAFARHKELMQLAKKLLTAGAYDRLASIGSITKNREDAIQVLEAMSHMLRAQLLRQPSPAMVTLADGLQSTLARLAQNGNPRAQLTALFVNQ